MAEIPRNKRQIKKFINLYNLLNTGEILRKLTPSDGPRDNFKCCLQPKTKTDVGVVAWDFKEAEGNSQQSRKLLNKCFLAMQKQ